MFIYQNDMRNRTEESQYLRESLQRTKENLEQEKRLNSAIKHKKVREYKTYLYCVCYLNSNIYRVPFRIYCVLFKVEHLSSTI